MSYCGKHGWEREGSPCPDCAELDALESPKVAACYECGYVKLLIDGPECQDCVNRGARVYHLNRAQDECLYDV